MIGIAFKKYCAILQKVDIRQLEYETEYMFMLSSELSTAEDNNATNRILRKAVSDLGLQVPWGTGELDEKMQDKNWVLKF